MTHSTRKRPPARSLAYPALLTALVVVYLSWQLLGWIPGDHGLVGGLLFIPIMLAALCGTWSLSRGASARTRLGWRLVALGITGQALGSLTALYYEQVLEQSPYPSLADPLYLSFYPLALAGLLTMRPAGGRASSPLKLALDLATVALGGAAVVWYVVLGPTAEAGGQSPVQMAFSIAYPVGDMILIVGLASLILRGVTAETRRALWLLAAGLGLFVVGDLVYGYVTLHGDFNGGDALSSTYFVAFALFALAGRRSRTGAAGARVAPEQTRQRVSWVPYLGVAAGFTVLVISQAEERLFPNGVLALAAALLAALVSARQLLAQRALVHARAELQSAHDDLARAYEAERAAAAERERMELELRLAQKLEAVGQLAAGIAHEINTPIQFVGDTGRFVSEAFDDVLLVLEAYAELGAAARSGTVTAELLERVAEAEEYADLEYLRERLPSAFDRISDGVGRVTTIVGAMRTFAHPSTDLGAVDINESIRTTLVVAANEYRYLADVTTDLAPLPPVICSASDLNQVLLNLIVNAAHAIADATGDTEARGRIDIRTRREGDAVAITVADTGCGIPDEVAGRVFDPFFTTKEVGRGTGQGLAIAHTIVVERHGGTLTFESEPGRGTTFTVTLPLVVSVERVAAA